MITKFKLLVNFPVEGWTEIATNTDDKPLISRANNGHYEAKVVDDSDRIVFHKIREIVH